MQSWDSSLLVRCRFLHSKLSFRLSLHIAWVVIRTTLRQRMKYKKKAYQVKWIILFAWKINFFTCRVASTHGTRLSRELEFFERKRSLSHSRMKDEKPQKRNSNTQQLLNCFLFSRATKTALLLCDEETTTEKKWRRIVKSENIPVVLLINLVLSSERINWSF